MAKFPREKANQAGRKTGQPDAFQKLQSRSRII